MILIGDAMHRYRSGLAGLALLICATCYCLDDWFLGPLLVILAALLWHTRNDLYAVLPGFGIGFFVGVLFSAGIGPAAALDCGLYGGAFGSPINAICRGFWRGGTAALLGILAYIATVQTILLLLFWNA